MIIKVDSGPGRTNLEMLAYMRAVGVYCYPGVPNTTHVSQETDQNYGVFKSVFRENLEILSQARFDLSETLQITDLPLLVFGGKDPSTNVDIRDSFSSAFSVEANIFRPRLRQVKIIVEASAGPGIVLIGHFVRLELLFALISTAAATKFTVFN